MAAHQQLSPNMPLPLHHSAPHPMHVMTGQMAPQEPQSAWQVLAAQKEGLWVQCGSLAEQMNDHDTALECFNHALRCNQWSVPALHGMARIYRARDQFPQALDCYRTILKMQPTNGEVLAGIGHCNLMLDDLQSAYTAYQEALYHLSNPRDPKLWYGIGILYDRYGSLEHAEEAFTVVLDMDPNFDKAHEIYFRLGIIYKQQQKYSLSLDCFRYIVRNPPKPLTQEDIWFQIGHVYEQQKEFEGAKDAYRRVLTHDPNHAKVLQQLGWLHHQQSEDLHTQEQAIEYLEKSVKADRDDAHSWYLLGRCYMTLQKYPRAYEAYQQAVYRDGKNPTFWCSIGVLYYQINQYRDALDAYSRAIRLNPNISEVWYDLGTLYESCNNQTADALNAYERAADLDPTNVHIKARLQLLQSGAAHNGAQNRPAPAPQDVHPNAYQAPGLHGPAAPQWGTQPQPAPPPPPQGPAPPAGAAPGQWQHRPLAGIREDNLPPQQQPARYDQRDGMRPGPQQHTPHRPASPSRQEPMRPYQEPARPPTNGPGPAGPSHPPGPGPMRRGMSPSPKTHSVAPSPYHPGPQIPPQAGPSQLPPHQAQPQPQPQPPNRISNPNYGPHAANAPPSGPPPPPAGIPAPPTQGLLYGRMGSPHQPLEVRPIIENRAGSPRNGYPGPYQHHPDSATGGGIASGAPAPASALAAAEAAAREREREREREERPPTAPGKRHREWEDNEHNMPKPPSNDEKRQKMEPEPHSRRPSPPVHRMSSPQVPRHSPQDAPDARRFNDGYHPSEAAHHPPSLPSMAAGPPGPAGPAGPPAPPAPLPRMAETPTQERPEHQRPEHQRPEHHEPAARRMDVDENYDDEGEEPKPVQSERGSPRNPPNGNMTHQAAAADPKP